MNNKSFILWMFLAAALLVTSCSDETDNETNRMVCITVNMPKEYASTRVGLDLVEGEKTLVASFLFDDKFSVYVRQGDMIKEVESTFSANFFERKEGTLKFALPAFVKENEEYTIYGICGASSRIKDGRLVVDDNSKIEPINEFTAPIWFKYTGKKVPSILPCEYIGTYIVLHVTNQSDTESLFQINGLISNALYNDLYWDENTKTFSEDFGVSPSSKSVSLKPREEGVFIYNGIPNGKSMETLDVSMHIGPEITWGMDMVKPESPKTVGKTLEEGRAYHVYLTWDGKELKFEDGEDKIEIPESYVYPVESYSLSDDGTILVFWRGDEKVVNLKADPAFSKLTTIYEAAFGGALELQTLVIPKTVTTLGYWPDSPGYYGRILGSRKDLKLREIIIDEDNPNYSSKDGLIYNKDKTILYEASLALKSFTIANSVKEINDYAFAFNERVTNIILPSSLEIIGKSAFAYCKSLKNLQFPSSLRVIGERAFNECFAFTDINLPNSVEEIGVGAFMRCQIKNFIFPPKVTDIPDMVLEYCSQLESVTLPATATRIGIESFDGCRALCSIDIPETVTIIGYLGFGNCSSLASITIPKNVTSIDRYAFFNCTNLKTVHALPATPPTVEDDTFKGMPLAQCKLYVYPDCKSKYIQAEGWKDFGIIKTIENQ